MKNELKEIAQTIKQGGVVLISTDTLPALSVSALNKKAVGKVYRMKGRDENKPFIILISSVSQLKKFDIKPSKKQKDFIKKYWPGSVSVILECPSKKWIYLHRGNKSLAFRLPKNKDLIALLKKTGPLTAPSANPQGKKPAQNKKEAHKYFGEKIDFYTEAKAQKTKPSTLVSLVNDEVKVLRQGSVRIAKSQMR